MEPKVVFTLQSGQKIYWCPNVEQQMTETVCKNKNFSRGKKACRLCLGKSKREHWTEPWASLGRKEEDEEPANLESYRASAKEHGFDPNDEPVPCEKCGRVDLPLHTDFLCPECSPKGKDEPAAGGSASPASPQIKLL